MLISADGIIPKQLVQFYNVHFLFAYLCSREFFKVDGIIFGELQ